MAWATKRSHYNIYIYIYIYLSIYMSLSPPSADQARASPRASPTELSRDADVRQARAEIGVHKDVLRLYVAVDYHRLAPCPCLRLVQVLHVASAQPNSNTTGGLEGRHTLQTRGVLGLGYPVSD